jgi:hypothetical protein
MTDAMLIATANCSIGDKKKHLNARQVKNLLLGKKPKNVYENYALKIIKTEALQQEIEAFAQIHNLQLEQINKVLYAKNK